MNTIVEKNDCSMKITTYEGERIVSWGSAQLKEAHLNGAIFRSATVGGLGTSPEFRRLGMIRKYFDALYTFVEENNCALSFLHPFSFAYYRKFGYERIADHRILEFPMKALDFVPRYSDLVFCEAPNYAEEIADVYNRFAANRNLMFRREAKDAFRGVSSERHSLFLLRDETGTATGYLVLEREKAYQINRSVSINLHVHEICFTSPDSLLKLFGFLRMFEGDLDSVKIHNCAMAPEIEQTLRHYTHLSITDVPDIMARVHDVEAVLRAVRYPDTPGTFTVKVTEPEKTGHPIDKTDGVWRVTYSDGTATSVERLTPDSSYDLSCDIPAFTQLLFGFHTFGAEFAAYIPNVTLCNRATDFFRAFPARPSGLFEHF